jgi:hypothetical protein
LSRPFLVAFVGRSGSTALMLDLERHRNITAHLELFGAPILHRGLPPTDENRIDLLRQIWGGYLPGANSPEREQAIGFKFQFKRSGPQFGDFDRLAAGLKPYHPVIIALWRRDLLRQAISTLRARAIEAINEREIGLAIPQLVPESGPRARAYAAQPMHLPIEELRAEIEAVQGNIADMRGFLSKLPSQMMISYETYLQNRPGVLKRIAEALELEPFPEEPEQPLGKITSGDLSKAIANWEEVAGWAQARGLLGEPEGEARERNPERRRLRRRMLEIRRRLAALQDEEAALMRQKRELKRSLAAIEAERTQPA